MEDGGKLQHFFNNKWLVIESIKFDYLTLLL